MAAVRFRPYAMAAVMAAACTAPAVQGQVPTKCLEIESILVDACVSPDDCPASTEGMNEMVRFITGPQPIALTDLQFAFYSSTFRGIEQTSATASLTAQLNATIQSCGHLLEPPAGIIPPGSRVIFVTSTAMCVEANPFHALSDTLYIIFQKAGNSQGHFKNNDLVMQDTTSTPGPPLLRTLQINVPGISCGDTVAYDANRLVNVYGNYGGQSEENDGATVDFAWPGTPTASYVNYGCQAPFEPTVATVLSGGGAVACGGTANLAGSVTGGHVSVLWQGGSGSFSDPHALATTYAPGAGDGGGVLLSFCAITVCGDTVCAQVALSVEGGTPSAVDASDTAGCAPHCITFTAGGSADDAYTWDFGDGGTGSGMAVQHCYTLAGSYVATLTVQQANGCPDLEQTVGPINVMPVPHAQFSWEPEQPTVGNPEVQFTDGSTDATAWLWHFGITEGASSIEPSPSFLFPGVGCWPVSLAVSNEWDCTDTARAEICVTGADTLRVPNVFSPNGDGVNDVFRVQGNGLHSLDVRLFNRWGQLVARLERVNQVWDGRSPTGEVLSEGTYFYTLRAQDGDGKTHDLNGTVTLVR